MKINIIIWLVAGLLACSCASNDGTKENAKTKHTGNLSSGSGNNTSISFEDLSWEEILNTNRRLSSSIRENFRWWNTNEPERWGYLSQKFANEVIAANPHAKLIRKNIEPIFVKHLEQQAIAEKADDKDINNLKMKANNEFRFNLIYEIGMIEFNNWQKMTKVNLEHFKQLQDSLNLLVAEQTKRMEQYKK